MAAWIYNRPPEKCDKTEFQVAQLLNRLPDDWLIRWGYYYNGDREGVFLVFGLSGGLLVLEVKGGPMRKLGTDGAWEGEEKDHPVTQLLSEWDAVLGSLQAVADGRCIPFVAKALALPSLRIVQGFNYKTIDRLLILDRTELEDFQNT